LIVLLASFRHSHLAWKIGTFDIFCGAVSVLGVVFWLFVGQATVALLSFVAADQVAALPTLRKSWIAPSTETARTFFLGSVNCAITLMALQHFTTAGALFPGCILVTDLIIGILVVTRMGPRLRGDNLLPTSQRMAGT
jgi:hypothetical protein